jgi:hypothetical protein
MTGIAVLFEKRLHIEDKIHRSRGERGGEEKQADSHDARDTPVHTAFPITPHGKFTPAQFLATIRAICQASFPHKAAPELEPGLFNYRGICWLA